MFVKLIYIVMLRSVVFTLSQPVVLPPQPDNNVIIIVIENVITLFLKVCTTSVEQGSINIQGFDNI